MAITVNRFFVSDLDFVSFVYPHSFYYVDSPTNVRRLEINRWLASLDDETAETVAELMDDTEARGYDRGWEHGFDSGRESGREG